MMAGSWTHDYQQYLRTFLAKYKNKDETKREVLQVFTCYGDLKPNLLPHVFNDGSRKDLFTLEGTIPVQYKGSTYNFPICMYLMETHPANPPLCYVRPTDTMELRTGKHVDSSGRIYLPYLHEWTDSAPDHDLIGLIEVMRVVFGEEPPVAAKSSASHRQTTAQLYRPPRPVTTVHTRSAASLNLQPQIVDDEKKILHAFNRLSLKVRQTELTPIARSLGLDKKEIGTIKTSASDDLPDQVYLTLEKWREKEGEAATLSELEQHLRELDLHRLADSLLGTPTSAESRSFETKDLESGRFHFQEAAQPQSSKYPSVTVDAKFPIIEFDRLHFPEQSYLGRGGFAAVAKAHHRDWKHDVAVKCLLTRETEGSEQQLLYSEARKLNLGSRSTCIISLLGVCLDPNFAIVMPYMENGSLASLLQDVDVPWALRWRMAHEISLGMTFLHCQNPQILHCDLKAENVLLDEDFHVKISDFGLSKWRTESRIVTGTSPTGATITHAPPEFITDINLVPNDKFDVYSFGVLLWEIITRRIPYENAMNSALIELGVRTGQRPDMSLVPTDVPDVDTVSQLMQACWSQTPEDRPSFQECADQLWTVRNKFSKENILEAIIYVQKEKFGLK